MDEMNNTPVSTESEEYAPLMPVGWTGEGDFFDESTWGTAATDESAADSSVSDTDGTMVFDGAPTTEQTGILETGVGEAGTAPTTEQDTAGSKKLKFTSRIDHEDRDVELDEAELPTIYQKAYATDRAQERLAELQKSQDEGSRLAKTLGFDSLQSMYDSARQSYVQSEVDKLTSEGVHPELARDLVQRRLQSPTAENGTANASVPETASTESATPAGRDYATEVSDLLRAHPELRGQRLPDEVVRNCVQGKQPLSKAYADYEKKQHQAEVEALRKESSTLKHNADAARRAPVRGVSGGGATDMKADDPFMAGFNSVNW